MLAEELSPGYHGGLEFRLGEAGEDVVRQSGAERIAAECSAVVAGHDLACHVFTDDGGTYWKSIAERFCSCEHVRMGVFWEGGVSPECAGAGETALDLVEYEEGADFCAAGAESCEKFRGGYVNAAFSLDGLDEDAASLVGDKGRNGIYVVVAAVREAREHGAERFLVLWIGRGG